MPFTGLISFAQINNHRAFIVDQVNVFTLGEVDHLENPLRTVVKITTSKRISHHKLWCEIITNNLHDCLHGI